MKRGTAVIARLPQKLNNERTRGPLRPEPQGVIHFRVKDKRDKIRFIPVHAQLSAFIE
jgi:hypothetical protein